MTKADNPETRLAGEIEDLLDAGSVGLYEFIWQARSSLPTASDEERRQYARTALGDLLARDNIRLILLAWPKAEVVGEASIDHLPADAWEDPVEGKPYVAITRS